MGLADLAKGPEGDKPRAPIAISIKAEPLDASAAGRKMLEAISSALGLKAPIHEEDVEKFVDGFKLLNVATEDANDADEAPDEGEKSDDEPDDE